MTSSLSLTTSNNCFKSTLQRISNSGTIILLDGGTGEELFRRGVPDDRKIWSAKAVVDEQYHNILKDVHKSYLHSGSSAITTNSYGITPGVGFTDNNELTKWCALAGKLAREAVEEYVEMDKEPKKDEKQQRQQRNDGPFFVLGSLGPLLESYRPDKLMSHEEGVKTYGVMARALEPYVDCFIAETTSCVKESSQAIDAVSSIIGKSSDTATNVEGDHPSPSFAKPMMVSYTLSSDGTLRDGQKAPDAVQQTIERCREKKVDLLAILFNCCEPEAISMAFDSIQQHETTLDAMKRHNVCLGAYANRLTPVAPDWEMSTSDGPQPFRKDVTPEEYYDKFVSHWKRTFPNVTVIGGCCGITPEHISYLRQHI